jgi:hypothetical protein
MIDVERVPSVHEVRHATVAVKRSRIDRRDPRYDHNGSVQGVQLWLSLPTITIERKLTRLVFDQNPIA